ncbi:unnamed protein product [marine sediment metagenome]|uniref:Uncharacterized protein n=1 Tax=marine sediment metagenome TaxID=412755 RepID=X1BCH5_9ZZZZ
MKKFILPLILIFLLTFILIGDCIDYTSQYPPEQSDTYVKATTYNTEIYYPYFATDPALSLTGIGSYVSWIALENNVTNQRFHIDLGEAKYIRRIYYENYHHSGGYITRGVQNFTFWGSNEADDFADLTYANDGDWTELTVDNDNKFDKHSEADEADPKYIVVTNSTAYRYYALKIVNNYGDSSFMGVRRIDLQTEDGYLPVGITWNDITISKWNTKEIIKWNDLE